MLQRKQSAPLEVRSLLCGSGCATSTSQVSRQSACAPTAPTGVKDMDGRLMQRCARHAGLARRRHVMTLMALAEVQH